MIVSDALSNMVKQQLMTNQITSAPVIELFETLPRSQFFADNYHNIAYSDARIPLGHGQYSLTPLEEAKIIQTIKLSGNEHVLEIGTGCGYLTALLAKMAKKVTSIDIFAEFTEQAKEKLLAHNINNVSLKTGDASRGWPEAGPYDVIVISGGLPQLGQHFKPQLMKEGRLFAIVGQQPAMHAALFELDKQDNWHESYLFDTDIAMLNGKVATEAFNF